MCGERMRVRLRLANALKSSMECKEKGFLTDSGNLLLIADPDSSVFCRNRFNTKLSAGRNDGLFQVRHIAPDTQLACSNEKMVYM